jgi:hypothetical protein
VGAVDDGAGDVLAGVCCVLQPNINSRGTIIINSTSILTQDSVLVFIFPPFLINITFGIGS